MLREVQFTKIVWPTFLNSSEGLYYLLQLLVFVNLLYWSFRAEFFYAKLWKRLFAYPGQPCPQELGCEKSLYGNLLYLKGEDTFNPDISTSFHSNVSISRRMDSFIGHVIMVT